MAYAGGLRARLIHDNIFRLVKDGLGDLGWLDNNRDHKPFALHYQQVDNDEKVEPNIVCVTVEDVTEDLIEMGSDLSDHYWNYYIDLYVENDVIGLHVGTDIKDILKGRLNQSVDVVGPNVTVYDLSLSSATPVPIFHVEIQDVDINKSRFFHRAFQKYTWVISFRVVDCYDTESD